MKQISSVLGIIVIAALVVLVGMLLRNSEEITNNEETGASQAQELPTAIPPESPLHPEPPFEPIVIRTSIAPPTSLPPVDPTLVPTPVVTRVPLATPPYIDVEPSDEEYSIIFAEGDVIKAINSSNGSEVETLIDVHAETGLYLGRRNNGVNLWASPSPDGKQLAVVLTSVELGPATDAWANTDAHIYLLDMETTGIQLLLKGAMKPVWSPDGNGIAYYDIATRGLHVIDLSDRSIQEIISFGMNAESTPDWFTWSPDGRQIAFVQTWGGVANSGGIWRADIKGAFEPIRLTEMEINATDLAWSPTSERILYLSSAGERDTPETPTNLWVVSSRDGSQMQMTKSMGVGGGPPVWSSDGRWVLFSGTNLLEGDERQNDLWLLSEGSDELKRITNDAKSEGMPQWTPLGDKIIFRKVNSEIFELDILRGTQRQMLSQDVPFVVSR